jgi:hypothetical protein
MGLMRHVAYMVKMRKACSIWVGKTAGKRQLERPKRRWEDNIRIWWDRLDWIHLAQDSDQWRALVNMVMKLWVPYKAGNFLTT